jgi:putative Mg2+ transporter-C (MgtC) family protein
MFHEDMLKLVVAAVLGIFIGLERELKRKPLGLKTCLVISVTSCLLTIVSMDISVTANQLGGIVRSDPMRLAAQIVSGIGFLGAGVILRKNNEVISGLTTAAIVWASSGLGIAVGAGFYADAVVGLLLIVISVELVPWVMRRIGPQALSEKEVEIRLVLYASASIPEVLQQVEAIDQHIEKIKTSQMVGEHKEVTLICVVKRSDSLVQMYQHLEQIEGVIGVYAEQL